MFGASGDDLVLKQKNDVDSQEIEFVGHAAFRIRPDQSTTADSTPDVSSCSLTCSSTGLASDQLVSIIVPQFRSNGTTSRHGHVFDTNLSINGHERTVGVYMMPLPAKDDPSSCLIITFIHEDQELLRAFQAELDAYCKLNAASWSTISDQSELNQMLCDWLDPCVLYIERVVRQLSDVLPALLFALMVGRNVSDASDCSSNATKSLTTDVRRMAEFCCGIQQQMQGDTKIVVETSSTQNVFTVNCEEETEFTDEWALILRRLLASGAGAQAMKDVMLSFKHKAYNDLNAFTRLLGTATNDHYVLYRTLEFLRKSRNHALLICWARHQSGLGADEQRLIDLLEEHLNSARKF